MRRLIVASALLCALGVTSDAYAWGDIGHKIICEMAFNKVKPGARAAIVNLIKADGQFVSFSDACTWPDHPRKRPEEHFINLARDAAALADSCGVAPKCVVTAIAKDFAILSSNTATADQKAASLKFLGHWVGDVHQPLHVSFQDDRGGNNINVSGLCTNNLHSAWDTCLVAAAVGNNVEDAASNLLTTTTQEQIQEWTQSDPKQWANESFNIAKNLQTNYCVNHGFSCDPPSGSIKINQAYVDANVPIVKEQLQKAGIRLAHLLDKALGE